MADRTVKVVLLAQYNQFVAGMARAGASVSALGKDIDKATETKKGRQALDDLTGKAALLGAGLLGVAAAAVKLNADFDQAMSAVKANIDDKSVRSMKALSAAALQAGKDTQFSAIEAAQGEDELAKAGVSAKNILGGGLKGALNLAAAGQLDVASASEIAASALNDFHLAGSSVPHIADLLAAGADKAQGSVQDLGSALKYVGPVAGGMGISIESTVGVLTEFASRGIMGEQAGTSLRGMLSSLTSPSAQARAQLQALNIQLYDGQGRFLGLANLAGQLHDKLAHLTDAQRDQVLGQIFGNEQLAAARILYQDGAAGVEKFTKAVDDNGFAAQTAHTKMDNLAGDLHMLRSSLETDLIQAGSGANAALREMTQGATAAVNAFGDLPGPVQQALVWITGISGAAILAGSGLVKLKSTVGNIKDALVELGPTGAKAAGALGTLFSFAGKATLVGAAFLVIYEGAKKLSDWVDKGLQPVKRNVDDLTRSIQAFINTGKSTGELQAIAGKSLTDFAAKFRQVSAEAKNADKDVQDAAEHGGRVAYVAQQKIAEGQKAALKQMQGDVKAFDDSLSNLAKGGNATAAKAFFDQLVVSLRAEGYSMDQINKMFPQYAKAAADAAASNTGLAKGFGDATTNAQTLADTLGAAVKQGQSLMDVWNQLNGALSNTDSALLQANKDVDALKQSMIDNGTAFDQNTTKGLANRVALEQLSKDAAAAAQAKYEETGSVDQATATWQRYKDQAQATLQQMGLTQAQAQALVDQMFQFPPDITVPTSTPGATQSADQLSTVRAKEAELERKIAVLVKTNAPTNELQRYQQQLDALHDKEITIFTRVQTDNSGTEHVSTFNAGGRREAEGGIVDFYANGGIREPAHIAQIVPAGTYRVMAESETGGEAYIPLAAAKRPRSLQVWEATGRRLGVSLNQMSMAAPAPAAGGGRYPSADAIGRAMAQHLSGPLGQVAAAMMSGRQVSVQIEGREVMRAVDEARRVESYVG